VKGQVDDRHLVAKAEGSLYAEVREASVYATLFWDAAVAAAGRSTATREGMWT